MEYICLNCKETFIAYHKNAKYCSNKCRFKHWKKTKKFAGKNNPMSGVKRPDLSLRNKSDAQRQAVTRFNKSRKHSDKTKKLIGIKSREAQLRNKRWKGKDNPFYTENKPTKNYYLPKALRLKVLEKCMNSCTICGSELNLNIHHVKPRRLGEKNLINNLTILCKKCHTKEELKLINKENGGSTPLS